MNKETYFKKLRNKFEQDGFELCEDTIGKNQVIVAKRLMRPVTGAYGSSIYRVAYYFIFGYKDSISEKDIQEFSKNCVEYGKSVRTFLRGGVILPVLSSSKVSKEAISWVNKPRVQLPTSIFNLKIDALHTVIDNRRLSSPHWKRYAEIIDYFYNPQTKVQIDQNFFGHGKDRITPMHFITIAILFVILIVIFILVFRS